MATIIRIKRSTGQSAPGSLKSGELAYSAGSGLWNNGGDRLYYGKGDDGSGNATSVVDIGGEYYANLLDHNPGTLTASSAIITDASSKIDQILVDNIGIGVSDANTITSTDTNGNIVLSPNGTGTVDVATSRITSVTDPTSAQDAATKAYVDAQVTAQDLDFQTDSSVALSIDLDTETLTIAGGTSIGTRSAGNTVTIDLDPTGVTPGSYGSTTQIPVITVNSQGQLTAASTTSLATTLNLDGDVGTGDVALLDSSLEIAGGTNITTTVSNNTVTVALDDSAVINGSLTVDNLKFNGSTIYTPGATTLYLDPHPVGDSGDVVILGNLTVQGTTTTVNSTVVSLNDLNLVLADSAANAGEADGAGLTVGGDLYSGTKPTIQFDAATDRWDFSKDIEVFAIHTDSATVGNLYLSGNTISSTSGNITLSPTGSLQITGLTDTRIPFSTDNSGTITSSSNFTFNDVTSTLDVQGRITTNNATIDSAEIGVLTGTSAQFDGNVTVNGLVDTNTLVADSASILGDIRITGSFIDITTDELTEGSSNLYYTTSRVDSDMGAILTEGEGIDITEGAGIITIAGEDATVTNKGIASFGGYADSAGAAAPGNQRQFELTSGDVRIAIIDGGTY